MYKKLVHLLILVVFLFSLGYAQDSSKVKNEKIDWLKFNINAALIANNSLSNFSEEEFTNNNSKFSQNSSMPVCFGFSGGGEFLLGRSFNIKQIIGITYDYTNSNFRNDYEINPGIMHSTDEKYNLNLIRKYQFIDINYGFLIRLNNRLKLATLVSVNFIHNQINLATGYIVKSGLINAYSGQTYYDSTYYNKSAIPAYGNASFFSFKFRLSYDFKINEIPFSAFISANLAADYRAPWWMIGLQYYPFRKLR